MGFFDFFKKVKKEDVSLVVQEENNIVESITEKPSDIEPEKKAFLTKKLRVPIVDKKGNFIGFED